MLTRQHLLDKRVVRRALEKGLLDKAQYQKALDQLPDLSANVQRSSASLEPAFAADSQTEDA